MSSDASSTSHLRVGVLALQGSFREHIACLKRCGVEAMEVRTKEELEGVAGLIIPGGESTTMALVAERWGLIPELQGFAKSGRPIWGTCAGMIFLAERAEGQKKGGQALLGGLDVCVSRNFFGAQVNSFETQLPAPEALRQYSSDDKFRAVFIRAPAVVEAGGDVEVLARCTIKPDMQRPAARAGADAEAGAADGGNAAAAAAAVKAGAGEGRTSVIVAVRQGPLLATAFHPELTTDVRWHQLFVDMVRRRQQQAAAAAEQRRQEPQAQQELGRAPNRPADLPVYGQEFMQRE